MRKRFFSRQITWMVLFVFVFAIVSGTGAGMPLPAAAENLPGVPEGGSLNVPAGDPAAPGGDIPGAGGGTGDGTVSGRAYEEAAPATGPAAAGDQTQQTFQPMQFPQDAGGSQPLLAFVRGSGVWEADQQGGEYTVYFHVYSDGSYQETNVRGTVQLKLVSLGGQGTVVCSVYRSDENSHCAWPFSLHPEQALAAGQYALQVELDGQAVPALWLEGDKKNQPAVIEVRSARAVLPSATVSGEVYWHTEQDQEYYTLFLSSPVTGEVYLALKDAQGSLLAASGRQELNNQNYFYAYLYSLRAPLPTGEYPLQVILNGQPLEEVRWSTTSWNETGPPAVVTVTGGILVDYLNNSSLLGRSPSAGDTRVYLEAWAYGLSGAEELALSVFRAQSGGAGEENITGACRGWVQGREAGGRLRLLYEVGLTEALSADCSYYIMVGKGNTSREVVLSSGTQTSLSVASAPSIYKVEAIDPAVGKLTLKTVNVPTGTYTVTAKKWEQTGPGPWDGSYVPVAELQSVQYDGSGVLNVQFVTADQKPVYLPEGNYQVEVSNGMVTAAGSTTIGYADKYFYEDQRCSAATVLWVKPVDILALHSQPQQLSVEALLANVDPGQADGTGKPSLALVKIDNSGTETVVAEVENAALTDGYHPKGYRFDSLYKLAGNLTVPANLSNEWEYRWRISCLNRQKEERSFLYSVPVTPRLGPAVKKVTVENGLASQHGGHPQGEPGLEEEGPSSFLVSTAETQLDFSLEDLFVVDDLSGLNVALKGPGTQDSTVGSLAQGTLSWADAARTRITGKVNITGALQDGATYCLVVAYSGSGYAGEIGRATVVASSAKGVKGLSLHESSAGSLFAAGKSFQVRLLGALNLSPQNVKVHLTPVGGEEEVPLAVAAAGQGNDIVLDCQVQGEGQSLEGRYELRFACDTGQGEVPLRQIGIMWDNNVNTWELSPVTVSFTPQAFVASMEETGTGFELKGGNFTSSKSYGAVLYREGDLASGSTTWRWTVEDLAVRASTTLAMSKDALNSLPRGTFSINVLENDKVLPVTQSLTLLLAEGEKPVVQPAVSINNGARFTTSPTVTVRIDPGSYTLYRMAESEEALAGASYQKPPASGTLSYTFADQTYGTKRLYFQFKDDESKESAVISASIDYVAESTSAPGAYGAGDRELPQETSLNLAEGARVTFWLKTSLSGATAGVAFYKADGSQSHAVTLLRGGKDEAGSYTYSRTVTIDKETYQSMASLSFYLRDAAAQGAWQSPEQAVNFEEATRINAVRSGFEKTYFRFANEFYALPDSAVSLRLEGTPNRTAAAVIKYRDKGGNEKQTGECALNEDPGKPGIYSGAAGLAGIPDAAEITGVIYRLVGPSSSAEQEENLLLKVAGTLKFTLDNAGGAFNGLFLSLSNKDNPSNVSYRTIAGNQTTVDFKAVVPGEYTYRLYDGRRTYAHGELPLAAGEKKTVDLAGVGKPAVLTLDAGDASVGGYISYLLPETGGSTGYWYCASLEKGKATIPGLQVGDTLRYKVSLDWSSLATYRQPDSEFTASVTAPAGSAPIQLEKLQTVNITGRVVDKALSAGGQKVPLPGAVVTFEQWLSNGSCSIHSNASVTTGEDGTFTLKVYPGVAGTLTIQKANYNTLQEEFAGQQVEESGQDIGDRELECRDRNFINVTMLLAPAVRPGETADYLPAAGRINSITAKKADGTPLRGAYSSWNGRFALEENQGLKEGDVITLKAYSWSSYYGKNDFEFENGGEVQVTLTRHLTGEAVFKGRSLGYISAQPASDGGADVPCHLLVFSENGDRRLGMVLGTGALNTSSMGLAGGKYTVVLLSGSDLTRASRINSLKMLDDLGLTAGVHYVKQTVEVELGRITDLGQIRVPAISNEDLGYLALQGTSITARQLEVTADGTIRAAVTVRYQLPERVANSGVAVSYVYVSLDGGKIKDGEYWFNGVKYTTGGGSYISFGTSGASGQRQGLITFTAEMTEVTTLKVSASVNLSRNNPYLYATEYIGAEEFPFSAVTIVSPGEVPAAGDGRICVQGVAPKEAEVEIWDNGLTVGRARANERGVWQALISLIDPGRPGIHVLQAVTRAGAGEEQKQLISAPSYTRVLSASTPVVEDITICQPYDPKKPWDSSYWAYRFKVTLGSTDDIKRQVLTINPAYPVFGRFKLVRGGEGGNMVDVPSSEVDYAAFVNDCRGVTTLFPATYNSQSGYWEAEMKLWPPGEISVVYSMKIPEGALSGDPEELAKVDVSYMTGSLPIDVSQLPDKPLVDPASLPEEIRSAPVEVSSSGQTNPDSISATLTIQGAQGGTATLTFSGTHQRVTVNLDDLKAQGFVRIDTAQGYYYTKAPEIRFGSLEMKKTVYFSPELYQALGGGSGGAQQQSLPGSTSTTQVILDKADYVSYLSGEVDLIVSTSQNPNALGSLGTGMTVFGGAVLAGQVALGRIGKDPAGLRNLAQQVEDANARARLMREIDEYASATQKSKYVNVMLGGVSYGASFFGPLGKGLSFVVSTGGQVFGKAVGDEYDVWYDAVLRMILVELEKQNRRNPPDKDKNKGGRKKKVNDPVWKIDPSGYVFEATESQRVMGVKATALVKDGDAFREWTEAPDYDEVNPQFTDAEGKYGWDVPEGTWKVSFEGEGYLPCETKEITVPPAHDQVNIGLLATAAPRVKSAAVYPEGAEIEFDRYMLPDSLAGNIAIFDADGYSVPVKEITVTGWVYNTGYTSDNPYSNNVINAERFALRVRAVPDVPGGSLPVYGEDGNPLTYTVRVSGSAASYAGVPMGNDYEASVEAAPRHYVKAVEAFAPVSVPKGTAFGSLGLPQTVKVTLEDDSTLEGVAVEWAEGSYDRLTPGSYSVEGTLVLPVGVANPDGLKARVQVTVTAPSEQSQLTRLELSGQAPANFAVGNTFALTSLTLIGYDQYGDEYSLSGLTITWLSSNPGVAAVSGSILTAVGAGTAEVRAVAGGIESNPITVTVTAPAQTAVPVTGVSLNKTELTLNVGQSETLTATVIPANASNKGVAWSSSNTGIATVDSNGTVTAVSAGTAVITVTTRDGGHTATCTVTVKAVSSGGGGGGGGGAQPGAAQPAQPTAPTAPVAPATTVSKAGVQSQIAAGARAVTVEIPAAAAAQSIALERDALQEMANANVPLVVKTQAAVLEIPPAALPVPEGASLLTVKAQTLTAEEAAKVLPPAGDLKPASGVVELSIDAVRGGTQQEVSGFAHPVKVRLPYNPSGVKEDYLGAYRYNEAGRAWEYVRSRVDKEAKAVEFTTTHFSKYTVMEYHKTFSDVQGHWAQNDIELMASRWVVRGVDESRFDPEASVTRAEFAVMLFRAAGIQGSPVEAPAVFSDVRPGQWFYKDLMAAYGAGLVKGYGGGCFGPDDPVTREQVVAMLVRSLAGKGLAPALTPQQVEAILADFADRDKLSAWAKEAAAAGIQTSLMKGRTPATLDPQANCTRAESAVLIKRVLERLQ